MAIQSTGLYNLFLMQINQQLITKYTFDLLSAKRTLLRPTKRPLFERTMGQLRSQLSDATALLEVHQTQQTKFSALGTSLDNIETDLDTLASLATSAIGASAATKATLQASANVTITEVGQEITKALSDNPDAVFRLEHSDANLSNLAIDSISPQAGDPDITVDIDVTDAGSQAINVMFDLSGEAGNTLDAQVKATFVGPLGSSGELTFNIGDNATAIANAINAVEDSTGIYAAVAGVTVSVRSRDFGSDITITGTEGTDPNNVFTAASVSGSDAAGTVSINSGAATAFTAVGRDVSFFVQGVSGTADISTNVSNGVPGAFTANQATIKGGGIAFVNATGTSATKFGFATGLTSLYGANGLDGIDLINSPSASLAIINGMRTQRDNLESFLDNVKDSMLTDAVTDTTNLISSLNTEISDIQNADDALALTESAAANLQIATTTTLLDLLTAVLPYTATSLVASTS